MVIDLLLEELIIYVIFTLDQTIKLFCSFSYRNLIMNKIFKSGASKRKRKKIENNMVKKIRPITALLHQPLAEATDTGSEPSELKLTQGNQCYGANQTTASIQPEENLLETAMQDVE